MSLLKNAACAIGVGLLSSGSTMAQSIATAPTDLVDALVGVFGKHDKARASHAKGICVSGYLLPDAQAVTVSKSSLWALKKIPVQGRFSVGGGNPQASDKAKSVRGLAMHVGEDLDLVTLSAPVFMVATPAEFVEFMQVRRPDPLTGKPDMARIAAFNEKTPSTKAQIDYLKNTAVPASYANAPYFGVNAFKFTNAHGAQVFGRWHMVPQAGIKGLTDAELAELSNDFLLPELTNRLATGPIIFSLMLQLATAQDDILNPAIAWPAANKEIPMGQVLITGLDASDACQPSMFNPAKLPAGIDLSDDPTLQVRAAAYGVSLGRRISH